MESAEILFSEREKPRIIGRCKFQQILLRKMQEILQHVEVTYQMLQVGLACLAAFCIPSAALR